jgi:hypothetical protein
MKKKLAEGQGRASCIQALKRGTAHSILLSNTKKHDAPLENIIKQKKQNTANIKKDLMLTAREKLDKKRTNEKETSKGSR